MKSPVEDLKNERCPSLNKVGLVGFRAGPGRTLKKLPTTFNRPPSGLPEVERE